MRGLACRSHRLRRTRIVIFVSTYPSTFAHGRGNDWTAAILFIASLPKRDIFAVPNKVWVIRAKDAYGSSLKEVWAYDPEQAETKYRKRIEELAVSHPGAVVLPPVMELK